MALIPTIDRMCVGGKPILAYALSQDEIRELIAKRPEVSVYFAEQDGAQPTERLGVAESQPADGANRAQPGTGDESEPSSGTPDVPALDGPDVPVV